MATIASLASGVTNRLEEAAASIFWQLQPELYPLIVEAMNLAMLITGEPQFRATSTLFTIPASTSFAPLALPAGALALLRVDSFQTTIDKTYVQDLDNALPGWEVARGPVPKYWMPFGLGQWGVHPNLTAPAQVTLSYVQFPVITARPYTGAENVPFQQEYLDGMTDWAAGMARFKESGKEFEEAIAVLNRALGQFEQLSEFGYRKGSLRFTKGLGSTANIVETRVR